MYIYVFECIYIGGVVGIYRNGKEGVMERERERCVIVILMEGDGGEAHGGYDNRIWMDGSAANK